MQMRDGTEVRVEAIVADAARRARWRDGDDVDLTLIVRPPSGREACVSGCRRLPPGYLPKPGDRLAIMYAPHRPGDWAVDAAAVRRAVADMASARTAPEGSILRLAVTRAIV